MRVERIGLEHHGQPAIGRRYLVHSLAVDGDLATGDFFQPGNGAQKRRFSAAGRADKNDEFAIPDMQVDVFQDRESAKGFLNVGEFDFAHRISPISSRCRQCRW
ncbi:hypothetical protein D3C73_702280 [compost metagenome]